MQINIKMMTEEAFATLQKNYIDIFEQIKNHPSDSTWLEGYLGFNPFVTKKYTIEDFELLDADDYSMVSFENGKILYEVLKELPRYIICNNRFWTWIIFEKAYRQSQHAVKLNSAQIIKQWWLGNNSKRSLMLNVMGRSYFRIMVSIDEKAENKYELSERLFEGHQSYEIYRFFVDRSMGMLPEVSKGYIRTIKELEEEFGPSIIDQQTVREIVKDARRIGSVMLVDNMSSEEIHDFLYKKMEKRVSSTK